MLEAVETTVALEALDVVNDAAATVEVTPPTTVVTPPIAVVVPPTTVTEALAGFAAEDDAPEMTAEDEDAGFEVVEFA